MASREYCGSEVIIIIIKLVAVQPLIATDLHVGRSVASRVTVSVSPTINSRRQSLISVYNVRPATLLSPCSVTAYFGQINDDDDDLFEQPGLERAAPWSCSSLHSIKMSFAALCLNLTQTLVQINNKYSQNILL